ncbi:MAG: hypothetical protein CSYNP_03926 [Syntrophus sp. SKADARSKE-3]|nr:hypothetical protein [Syntrophus sp. SKADARSKE-3]
MKKIRIGISACLLGHAVRYDGGHKWDHDMTEALKHYVDWIPVCPEVEYGLPVPREPMRLVGDPATPRLVTVVTGIDHTEGMSQWAKARLKALEKDDLCGFVFKSKSPSSGMSDVKVYETATETPGTPFRNGSGIFAKAFMDHFPRIPVADEERLNDHILLDRFIEQIFAYSRWQQLIKQRGITS